METSHDLTAVPISVTLGLGLRALRVNPDLVARRERRGSPKI
jgi:hypothetical protein